MNIMRQIILDTETTGLDAHTGDRIVEIGCVELVNRRLTGNTLHFYVNPERDSAPGALAVHGLSTEFLGSKPKFAEIASELLDFVRDAGIIIHNAPFDIGFLNAELERLGLPAFTEHCGEVIDTLDEARQMFPGKRNSLDALCERFGISHAHRTLHGALLDSELLAEVYLAMTRGQENLVIDAFDEPAAAQHNEDAAHAPIPFDMLVLPVIVAHADELAAHEAVLDDMDRNAREEKSKSVWRNQPEAPTPPAPATSPSPQPDK
jgi:DNA polymerase-3 subunit epsilon